MIFKGERMRKILPILFLGYVFFSYFVSADENKTDSMEDMRSSLIQTAHKAMRKWDATDVLIGVIRADTGEKVAAIEKIFSPATLDGYRYEPGSAIKPFIVSAYLDARSSKEKGAYITVSEDVLRFKGRNDAMQAQLHIDRVLLANSHKAAAALALETDGKTLYEAFLSYGLIRNDANATKLQKRYSHDIVRKALANGYGISVTPMRMLRAYAIFANGGYLPRAHREKSRRVMRKETAKSVSDMLVKRWRHFGVGRDLARVRIGVQTAKSRKIYKGRYVRNIDQAAYGFVVTPDGDAFAVGVMLIDPKKGRASEDRVIELFADTIRVLLKSE